MYLIDTNVVSDVQRRHAKVRRWMASVDPQAIYLSVITLGEIHRGVVSRMTKDPAHAGRLAVWLQTLRDDYRHRILPVTEEISLAWGRISAGRTRGIGDSLIAATASVHGLVVVTRNITYFQDTGIPLINPWDEPRANG